MNKLLIAAVALAFLISCSDSSQREEAERLQRKEAALARAQEEANRQKNDKEEQAASSEEQTDGTQEESTTTTTTPQEPQYQDVTTNYYSFSLARDLTCEEAEIQPCGVKLTNCSNGADYYCIQNLTVTSKTTKKLVTE